MVGERTSKKLDKQIFEAILFQETKVGNPEEKVMQVVEKIHKTCDKIPKACHVALYSRNE